MAKPGPGRRFEKGNPGRPKGAKNKFTCLKDSFIAAFEQLGGTAGLAEWARENQAQFYQMLSKMLPNKQEISGEGGGPVQSTITIRFVSPRQGAIEDSRGND